MSQTINDEKLLKIEGVEIFTGQDDFGSYKYYAYKRQFSAPSKEQFIKWLKFEEVL